MTLLEQVVQDILHKKDVRCHIGYFDEGTCLKVEILSEEKRNETSGHTGRN